MKTTEKVPAAGTLATKAEVQPLRSAKIRTEHLERLAIIYVRQSSPQQVLENRESTARQSALAQYAQWLSWPAERVLVIDEDQGQSGKTAENRVGFQRLLAEVTMEHLGLVIGLEMSRLARSSKDWHQLFELCGIVGTLLADQEGVYDANDPNDRLVASTLEKRGEEALTRERQVREEYDRFLSQTPFRLSDEERARIESLTSEIPALWKAPGTTNAERNQRLRCLVERVVLQVRCDREFVDATIHWAGGYESHHEIVRPVATDAVRFPLRWSAACTSSWHHVAMFWTPRLIGPGRKLPSGPKWRPLNVSIAAPHWVATSRNGRVARRASAAGSPVGSGSPSDCSRPNTGMALKPNVTRRSSSSSSIFFVVGARMCVARSPSRTKRLTCRHWR